MRVDRTFVWTVAWTLGASLLGGCADGIGPDEGQRRSALGTSGPSTSGPSTAPGASGSVDVDAPELEGPFGDATKTGDWWRVKVANAKQRGAVCNDGSPYHYLIRPGVGEDANKWLFFMKGGGYCGTAEECSQRSPGLMTNKGPNWTPDTGDDQPHRQCRKYPETSNPRGLLWADAQNPLGGFTTVYMHYCSSDVWSADTPADPEAGNPWHFRGKAIVKSVIEDLQGTPDPVPNLQDAKLVVISGGSAGGAGVIQNVDAIAEALPWAEVRGLVDGDMVPDVAPRQAESATPEGSTAAAGEGDGQADGGDTGSGWLWEVVADVSCLEERADNKPWVCQRDFAHVLVHHIQSPTFVFMDLFDMNFMTNQGVTDLCVAAECTSDAECGGGLSCDKGVCMGATCDTDVATCYGGTRFGEACPNDDNPVCGTGTCYESARCYGLSCTEDADCAGNDVCRQGLCAQKHRNHCSEANPCAPGHRCLPKKKTPRAQNFSHGVRSMADHFDGAYVSRTGTHTAANSCKFYELRVRGKRYVDTFANWLFETDGDTHVVARPRQSF